MKATFLYKALGTVAIGGIVGGGIYYYRTPTQLATHQKLQQQLIFLKKVIQHAKTTEQTELYGWFDKLIEADQTMRKHAEEMNHYLTAEILKTHSLNSPTSNETIDILKSRSQQYSTISTLDKKTKFIAAIEQFIKNWTEVEKWSKHLIEQVDEMKKIISNKKEATVTIEMSGEWKTQHSVIFTTNS